MPVGFRTDLKDQLSRLLDPRRLVVVQNAAGAVDQKQKRETQIDCVVVGRRQRRESASPLELDLTLQVLEEDEVLQENVPPEVAVAELQVHQLEGKRNT